MSGEADHDAAVVESAESPASTRVTGGATFELVEGATFALPDGSAVTVRDGALEMSDGRRLPLPEEGETITVERKVERPDGGTTLIRHTIRLSDVMPPAAQTVQPAGLVESGEEVPGEETEAKQEPEMDINGQETEAKQDREMGEQEEPSAEKEEPGKQPEGASERREEPTGKEERREAEKEPASGESCVVLTSVSTVPAYGAGTEGKTELEPAPVEDVRDSGTSSPEPTVKVSSFPASGADGVGTETEPAPAEDNQASGASSSPEPTEQVSLAPVPGAGGGGDPEPEVAPVVDSQDRGASSTSEPTAQVSSILLREAGGNDTGPAPTQTGDGQDSGASPTVEPTAQVSPIPASEPATGDDTEPKLAHTEGSQDSGPSLSAEEAAQAGPEGSAPGDSAPQSASEPADIREKDLPDVPNTEPGATPDTSEPIQPREPLIMGINCGKRSLRNFLWGSIPEASLGDEDDENEDDEPRAESSPKAKSLRGPESSILEEDESQTEEGDTSGEGHEASENADESFEFVDAKSPTDQKEEVFGSPEATDVPAAVATMVTVMESPVVPPGRTVERPASDDQVQESEPMVLASRPAASSIATQTSREMPDEHQAHRDPHGKHHLTRQEKLPSSGDLVGQAAEPVQHSEKSPEEIPAEHKPAGDEESPVSDDKPETASPEESRQELHRKLTPILQILGYEQPAEGETDDRPEVTRRPDPAESRRGTVPPNTPAVAEEVRDSSPGVGPEQPEPVSVPKVISYYESISPQRAVSPELPVRSRQSPAPVASADKPVTPTQDQKSERDPTKVTIPKVVNFAVPMHPQKVYLGNQEPDEMENIPIPQRKHPQQEPAHPPKPAVEETITVQHEPKVQSQPVEPKPEPVVTSQRETSVEVPPPQQCTEPAPVRVQLAPEPVITSQPVRQILIPVQQPPPPKQEPGSPDHQAATLTSSITETPGKSATPEPETEPEPKREKLVTVTTPVGSDKLLTITEVQTEKPSDREKGDEPSDRETGEEPQVQQMRTAPVYDPKLFEHEPKKPLLLTSEVTEIPGERPGEEEEQSPPYDSQVHDTRTLPMRQKSTDATEQPPPFTEHTEEDERTDPNDPFLPDNPVPGTGLKKQGWLANCMDLCCCCWAP